MARKPTYEEMEHRVKELEEEVAKGKLAEEELKREREIFSVGPVVIFNFSAENNWPADYVSSNVSQFGYQAEDFLSGRILYLDIIHPEDQKKVMSEVKEYSESGVAFFEKEYRIIQADGEIKWVYDFTVVRRNDKNAITHYNGYILDNTERKRAEDALQKSEELARAALNATTDMVYLTDTKGKILTVNHTAAQNLGKTPDELTGKKVFDFFPADVAKTRKKQGDKVTQSGKPLRFQDVRGGRSFDISIYPTLDSQGKTDRLAVFVADITERKQAEEAVRKEKKFTDTALDSQMDTFFLFDPSTGKAIRWNRTFRDIVGYTDEEIASLPAPISYYSPIDLERAIPFIEKVMTEGTGTIELELICKDGRRVPTEYRVAAIYDKNGKPEYLISIGRDITRRKQAEEALRESEETYRLLFSAETDAIIVVDAQTKHIVNANEAALALYGYERKEFLGLNAMELSAEPERSAAHIEKVISGKPALVSPGPVERLHKKKDRTTFPVEISSGVCVLKERLTICAIIRDITERKQAEEALKVKETELSQKAKSLEEVNTTLRILLNQRKKDKLDFQKKVSTNIRDLVLPYIERIKKTSLVSDQKSCIEILEFNLEQILSPFALKLSSKFLGLTPTEIRVADLVKAGKTTKEIAEFMHLSPKTVQFHRDNIREKFGIKKNKINLRTYLLSM